MATERDHSRAWEAKSERLQAALDDSEAANADYRDAIARVLAVHERITIPGQAGYLPDWSWCRPCGASWPCDTIRAVNG